MRLLRLKFAVLIFLLSVSMGFAATLTGTTYYMNSGGVSGNMNTIGDMVNDVSICPTANTYANATPGCDMSEDVGYNNNGTGDNGDDYYTGDLIVRTNDVFTVGAKFSLNGAAAGDDHVTLTATLPAGTGFIWDGMPNSCAMPGSSIDTATKTLTCIRENLGASWSEILELQVRVEGNAPNGSTPGDILVKYEAPSTTTITDGVRDGNDANLIKVTASPRWNIQKSRYTTLAGKQDDLGNDGWYIYYKF